MGLGQADSAFVQAANFNSYEQNVTVVISSDGPIRFEDSAVLHHVSGAHGEAENSFDRPDKVNTQPLRFSQQPHLNITFLSST